MATVTVANANPPFPAGTTVKIYPTKGFPTQDPPAGAPPGTEITSAAVAAGGSLTLTNAGIVEQAYYVLYAQVGGVDRYMHVYLEAAGEVTVIATQATGDFGIMTAGKTLLIKEGTGGKLGVATLNGLTPVNVAVTTVTANSRIFLQPNGNGTQVVQLTSQTAGTGFAIVSSAADTRTVNYLILEPA